MKEKPQELVASGGGSAAASAQRTAEELGGSDPDVQLCYCVEATFMNIISSTVNRL